MKRWQISDKTQLVRDVDGLSIHVAQDVTDIIEANKEQAKIRPDFLKRSAARLEVARFPTVLYFDLIRRLGPWKHNQEAWKRWLNDPDNRLFRTWEGDV